MTFEGEDIQQDANLGESSDAPQTSTENQPEVTASEHSASTPKAESQSRPFHEDPAIQDYIQRQVAKQASEFEKRMAELSKRYESQSQARQPQQPKAVHPLIEKFREIDPRYAEYLEGLEAKAAKAEELDQKFAAREQADIRTQFENQLAKLHGENKVPEEMQKRIRREIVALAQENPELGLNDLPRVYKEVLEENNKWIDSIKRSERASYVTDKTKDAKAPTSQPKGKPAVSNGTKPAHTDRESMMASVVKSALKRSRAESDI